MGKISSDEAVAAHVEQAVKKWFDKDLMEGTDVVKERFIKFIKDEFEKNELTQKNLKEELMDKEGDYSLVKEIQTLIQDEIVENNKSMKKEMEKLLDDQKRLAPEYALPEDTYSIMMQSEDYFSFEFIAGFLVWLFQVFMATLNFIKLYNAGEHSLPFDIPFQVDLEVRAGQICCLFLLLTDIDDIYRPFNTIKEALGKRNESVKHFYFPNFLKLCGGLTVAVISILLIITTNELFDLFSNFAGLKFISDIDNEVFKMFKLNVFGERMKEKADQVQMPLIPPAEKKSSGNNVQPPTPTPCIEKLFTKYSSYLQVGALITVSIIALGFVIFAIMDKDNYFYETHPNCIIPPSLIDKYGNGKCNGGILNTIHCQFDGGDCIDFNEEYKDCNATEPDLVGNGQCDKESDAFTFDCDFDGGDCCEKRMLLKDSSAEEVLKGKCNPLFNTDFCLNDYGLCHESDSTDTKCECQVQIEASNSTNIDSCGFKGAEGPTCISSYEPAISFTCEKKDNECTRIARPNDTNPSRGSFTRTIIILFISLAVGFVIGMVGRALYRKFKLRGRGAAAENDGECSNKGDQRNDGNIGLGQDDSGV